MGRAVGRPESERRGDEVSGGVTGSAVTRGPGVDREGVDATSHQRLERIINEAMPGDAGQAFEAPAHHDDAEVPAFARAGMAGVQVAVVLNLEAFRLQDCGQRCLDLACGDAHGRPRYFSGAGCGAGVRGGASVDAGNGFRCRLR